ncbi:exodeoxyribonuclease VII small subunit [Rudanella paleaurantiibacter]|uniref:Exodeoxyribonuclease VII small subunit n=1 Tax=Rudanella paleaurantiibacter TaxID=2614655 RepID=A0A7J5U5W6_9BACT|nr:MULTISPECIES: exodeoxyribonuclease VII small subunit [Rudanella]KAB7733239.1 exodeoxyribonuclease VII small subunit [Rudanella paleaurantiibacter]
MSYQEAYDQLVELIDDIESEATPLDELPAKIKLATDLIAYCQQRLRSVEGDFQEALSRIKSQ